MLRKGLVLIPGALTFILMIEIIPVEKDDDRSGEGEKQIVVMYMRERITTP